MTGFRVSRSAGTASTGSPATSTPSARSWRAGFRRRRSAGAPSHGHLAPAGPVYQAGTLSGNPVAVAAGLATLRHADDAVYATLDANADRLARMLGDALSTQGVTHRVNGPGTCCPCSSATTRRTTTWARRPRRRWRFPPFFHALLDRGRLPAAERLRGLVRLAALDDDAWRRSTTPCRTPPRPPPPRSR